MIKTERLILRQWKESDLVPFAKMNSDPQVMEFFPNLLTEEASNSMVGRMMKKIDHYGYGFWAAELGNGEFIGFIGLNFVDPTLMPVSFAPAVEIGWRLDPKYWGKGYAVEGAKGCLDYAFNHLKLEEVVAFTAVHNVKSRKVMTRIGMIHDANGDFDHPNVEAGHPMRKHVLYRIKNELRNS